MSNEILGDRRKALEDAFFAKQDKVLREKLAKADEARAQRDGISAASGITDPKILDQLVTLGISPETMAAMSLVPLVIVAWADGSIDARERAAVLAGAAESGLKNQDIGYQLLDKWLQAAPPAALLVAWKGYIAAITSAMEADGKRLLQAQLLDRARTVASAAGGFLGLGRRVSPEEEAVLADLASAFAA
jgi:hypothetical protein